MVPEAFEIGDTASQKVRLPDFPRAKAAPKMDPKIVYFRRYLQGFYTFWVQRFFRVFFGAGLQTGPQNLQNRSHGLPKMVRGKAQ